MAAHNMKGSLRRKSTTRAFYTDKWAPVTPMRPGKTAEDHRIGAWASKSERNGRQAAYQAQHQTNKK